MKNSAYFFPRVLYLFQFRKGSSEEVLDKTGAAEESNAGANGKERTQQQRSNTTVHVCWHRNTSISTRDHLLALEVCPATICILSRLGPLALTGFQFRISSAGTCCASSKTVMDGKSCGWYSPTSVSFSTKRFR